MSVRTLGGAHVKAVHVNENEQETADALIWISVGRSVFPPM